MCFVWMDRVAFFCLMRASESKVRADYGPLLENVIKESALVAIDFHPAIAHGGRDPIGKVVSNPAEQVSHDV